MHRLSTAALVFAIVCGLLSPCSSRGQTPAQADAGKKLAVLRNALPKMLSKLELKESWHPDPAAKLELARQTGPADAKLTIAVVPKDFTKAQGSAFVYLRFHDEYWTTVRWETCVYFGRDANDVDVPRLRAELDRLIPALMRDIDKIGAE